MYLTYGFHFHFWYAWCVLFPYSALSPSSCISEKAPSNAEPTRHLVKMGIQVWCLNLMRLGILKSPHHIWRCIREWTIFPRCSFGYNTRLSILSHVQLFYNGCLDDVHKGKLLHQLCLHLAKWHRNSIFYFDIGNQFVRNIVGD